MRPRHLALLLFALPAIAFDQHARTDKRIEVGTRGHTSSEGRSSDAIGAALQRSSRTMDVLGGVLTLTVPKETHRLDGPMDVRGRRPSALELSQLRIGTGSEHVLVIATQLWAKTGTDLESAVRAYLLADEVFRSLNVEPVTLRSGLAAARATPGARRIEAAHMVLVDSLFVASKDGFVQWVRLYGNDDAMENGLSVRGARAVLDSIEPGPHPQTHGLSGKKLRGWKADTLNVPVPEDGILFAEEGPDSVVYRIRLVGRLGSFRGELGMDVGFHGHLPEGSRRGNR